MCLRIWLQWCKLLLAPNECPTNGFVVSRTTRFNTLINVKPLDATGGIGEEAWNGRPRKEEEKGRKGANFHSFLYPFSFYNFGLNIGCCCRFD